RNRLRDLDQRRVGLGRRAGVLHDRRGDLDGVERGGVGVGGRKVLRSDRRRDTRQQDCPQRQRDRAAGGARKERAESRLAGHGWLLEWSKAKRPAAKKAPGFGRAPSMVAWASS